MAAADAPADPGPRPPDLDDLIPTLGGTPFVHPATGAEFQIRDFSLIDRAKYVRRLKDRAHAEVQNADVPDIVRGVLAAALQREMAAGVYDWAGEVHLTSLSQPSMFAYGLYLSAGADDAVLSEAAAVALCENRKYELLAAVAAAVQEAMTDPPTSARAGTSRPGHTSTGGSAGTGASRKKKRKR